MLLSAGGSNSTRLHQLGILSCQFGELDGLVDPDAVFSMPIAVECAIFSTTTRLARRSDFSRSQPALFQGTQQASWSDISRSWLVLYILAMSFTEAASGFPSLEEPLPAATARQRRVRAFVLYSSDIGSALD